MCPRLENVRLHTTREIFFLGKFIFEKEIKVLLNKAFC
jgi:hypothetical protein